MKRLLSTIVAISVFSCIGLAASLAAPAPAAPDDEATEDSLRINFVSGAVGAQTAPYFVVDGAYPGMKAETATVTLHNGGTVDADFDVAVAVTTASRGPQLAEVLQVTVTEEHSGVTAYRGPLSEVQFDGTGVLGAGGSVQYVMAIEWPDRGAADNAYQGMGLEFELRARARQGE